MGLTRWDQDQARVLAICSRLTHDGVVEALAPRGLLGWEPRYDLAAGLAATVPWVRDQMQHGPELAGCQAVDE